MTKTMKVVQGVLALAAVLSTQTAYPWWGNNSGFPYDVYQRNCSPCRQNIDWEKEERRFKVSAGLTTEFLFDSEGRDKDEKEVGTYQIYSPKDAKGRAVEPYGAFFEGAAVTDADIDFAERFHGLTNSDFGDVQVKGKRSEAHLTFWSSLGVPIEKVPGTVRLSTYMPFKVITPSSLALHSINAENVNTGVVDLSQSAIQGVLDRVGRLKSRKWTNNSTLGDLFVMLSWHNIFEQENETVQKVGLMGQVGVSLPTSEPRDKNNLYAVPTGADGAVGLPISGSADIYIKDNFRVHGSFDIYPIFKDTNLRRVRKTANQGELLLPESIKVDRDGGAIFRASAIAEFTSNSRMFWGGVGYQYGKKNEDRISTNNNNYSTSIINKSERWQEAEYHNILGYFGLDLSEYLESLAPCVNVSLRYPLKGKRISLFKVFGVELTVNI